MSRTFFSLRRRCGFGSRPPVPLTIEDARMVSCPGLFHLSSCIFVSSDDAISFETELSRAVVRCQPWVYLRLGGLVLFRVIRGGIGVTQRLGGIGVTQRLG